MCSWKYIDSCCLSWTGQGKQDGSTTLFYQRGGHIPWWYKRVLLPKDHFNKCPLTWFDPPNNQWSGKPDRMLPRVKYILQIGTELAIWKLDLKRYWKCVFHFSPLPQDKKSIAHTSYLSQASQAVLVEWIFVMWRQIQIKHKNCTF